MRILRFRHSGKTGWGILKENSVVVLSESPFKSVKPSRNLIPLSKVKILTPTQPSKVILVGLNYRDHARELKMAIPKEPVIFLKPPTAVIAHRENIVYPPGVKRLDYEAELAIVIKKEAKNIPARRAFKHILGYTCLNDVTARDLQNKDVQWTRAKSFDTFCPIGPWIETSLDPSNLKISCLLNDKIKQDSCTANFIFPIDHLISFISRVMTLLPGDVISTGTPSGVGPMRPGDRVEVQIEGIGSLTNRIAVPVSPRK
ncbi:MAG: fumarylacetoacetate hydrolase family protein [Candidatus Omnitrophica bacterium]|nr:fumarylacetoacetate hydrolase family protein [Candidatus Omnitrophota bacterium]